MDKRTEELARNLVRYSTNIQAGDNVLIEAFDDGIFLVKALVKEVHKVGARPFTQIRDSRVLRETILGGSEEQHKTKAEFELFRMKRMQAYIGIRGYYNVAELGDIPSDKIKLYEQTYARPVSNERVNNTKWVILRSPNAAMAQQAGMSHEKFEDFFYNVCNLDYAKMSRALTPLIKRMEQADKVRIAGPGTDLSFSIKDIPVMPCCGLRNIPDGEVFSAPVKDSVNGRISYNCPSLYQGVSFENIVLEFKDGKIVQATANNTERLNAVFNTDEGARYVGEFSLGLNPYIKTPMKDILFDEKIAGSFHFTPGQAYETADNGNRSAIHWDLVCIQNPEYGGGEVWFDGELIRKDGRFIPEDLHSLNPENLL